MDELRKFVAPEFVFGIGARRLAGRYAANLGGSRVLVVSDPGVVAAGWTADVMQNLRNAGMSLVPFNGVSPNPRAAEVMEGAELFLRQGCDLIVVVGGGSPIDCAKGIGLVAANDLDILKFEGVDNVPHPGPPLICIPTTSGTGADVSQFAIITDPVRRSKFAIVSKMAVPDAALIDPETTLTMDPQLTACTGMDVLSHAVEAICSTAHSPLYDLHAVKAVCLVEQHLRTAVRQSDDLEARCGMAMASLQAGLAFSNASLGAVHAMAHSLGGLLDLPHGECNAMLLPHVVAYNFPSAVDRCRVLAEGFGLPGGLSEGDLLRELLGTIESLKRDIGIVRTLADCGVDETELDDLTAIARTDPCMATNPQEPSSVDIRSIYARALRS